MGFISPTTMKQVHQSNPVLKPRAKTDWDQSLSTTHWSGSVSGAVRLRGRSGVGAGGPPHPTEVHLKSQREGDVWSIYLSV